ncbi:MAG TPA: hypothetical protein VFG95_06455 [Nitrospiria bacterium]|nr:hypothetical protein [Nitrospiria bacterium]
MDTRQKQKEVLRLLEEFESIIPEILGALARPFGPAPDSLVERLETFRARAMRLRESTDCLPAADLGRKGSA